MEYLTAEEITKIKKNDAHKRLGHCVGQLVRFDFAIKTFKEQWSKKFNNAQDIKTLDLGPGNGEFAAQLKTISYTNVYGVDIDNYLPEQRSKIFKELKIADLSADKIPWPDDFFDIVTAWCVLPHLENPFHCVREINRVLKKNGLFLFTVPHLTSKPALDYFIKHKNFSMYRALNNHIMLFTESIINKMLNKYFDVIEVTYAVRPKIFERGLMGKFRQTVYCMATKSTKLKKLLDNRWAYDTILVVRKK